MNPNLEHALRMARLHDQAKLEAQRLRREAFGAAWAALRHRITAAWAGWRRARPQWRRHALHSGAR
jgi:hypothetical protein